MICLDFNTFGFLLVSRLLSPCIYMYVYKKYVCIILSEKLDFQASLFIPIYYPLFFLLSSKFSPTFYSSLLFALKYVTGNVLQLKTSRSLCSLWEKYYIYFWFCFFPLSYIVFTLKSHGRVLRYLWIYVGSDHFLCPKFWIAIYFFFQKNEFSFGYDENADIILGSSQKMMGWHSRCWV